MNRAYLGEGLFETIRVVNGWPVYSKLHWQRLRQAALKIDLPFKLSFKAWQAKLTQLIRSSDFHEGGLKVVLLGGEAERGLSSTCQTTKLVFELFPYQKKHMPLSLIWADWSRDANNPLYRIKSINYLESVLAQKKAKAAGVEDVVFYNQDDHLTETCISNLFLIFNGVVCTPSLNCGVLQGIVRQRIFVLCAALNVPFEEAEIKRGSVGEAQAIFTTNALQGIRTVAHLDTHRYNAHPIITQLQDLLEADSPS